MPVAGGYAMLRWLGPGPGGRRAEAAAWGWGEPCAGCWSWTTHLKPHIRAVLRGYLEADGFAVSEAADGEEAVRQVRQNAPDLVLLDVMPPGIDGLEALRQVRTVSDVYVILVTARAEEVDKLVGLGVGADDYVTKPFSPREVAARVKAVLRRDRGVRETGAAVLSFEGLAGGVGVMTAAALRAKPTAGQAPGGDALASWAERAGRRQTPRLIMQYLLDRRCNADMTGDVGHCSTVRVPASRIVRCPHCSVLPGQLAPVEQRQEVTDGGSVARRET